MPKHSRIYRNFLLSYLVILILPSIAGYMSYRTSIEVTQTISIENGVTQLQNAQQLLERRMAEVEGFTRQLALNQDLFVLMNEKKSDGDVNLYSIWNVLRNVMVFGQTNDFLRNYYIYLRNYNVVLTPGSAYFRPEHYYETAHYRNMTMDDWRNTILNKPHSREILPLSPFEDGDGQTSVISYMQSLPLDSFVDVSPATVVVIIDEKTIQRLLAGVKERYGGWTYISDREGKTISRQGIEEKEIAELNGPDGLRADRQNQFYGDDLVIAIQSDKTGWTYRAGIPRAVLMENANHIKFISWTVTAIALVVGLLAGIVLSYRNSAPINRLLGVFRDQFAKDQPTLGNAYEFLHGNVANMLTNNKWLQSELDRQLPLVQDAYLKRLLAGEFQTRDEAEAAAEQAGLGFGFASGAVGILRIEGYAGIDTVEILNELNAARLLVKQNLRDLFPDLQMTDLGSDRVAALFGCSPEQPEEEAGEREIERLLRPLSVRLFDEYKISVTAAFGERFATALEVSRSCEQARETLEYADYAVRKDILWHRDIRSESATYYYPLETELRLIGTIRAGEREEARRMVEELLARNAESRELSPDMKRQLIGELKGTLLKVLDQKTFQSAESFEAVKNRTLAIQESDSLEAVREEIGQITDTLCGVVAAKKNDLHHKTVEEIKKYIAEKYSDAELTLNKVAEQVERPEKYISQLFKDVTGTNLSDYLEKIRMDRAAELLRDRSVTIDEIAYKVGYNSSHSFRRAFKRVSGVSPSAYRQSFD
ncbi:AraC family transcriptional regulator [Cohnella rhizosphaerae]|uniref:AraC family transcriptional regulator n=1 Tax=Cohnella rhizosphaerae TaxID=1457232 RepID=A0A9X4QUJ0_9BACL|nr:AraC family transcriptional regulator [Cohnella rhizosphaerae]MDG0812321.1 AraC family transcriptional regulator [Cohnella rhizosphaerae]